MAKLPVRNKKAPSRRPWSKDDLRLLKGMARKEPLAKIAQNSEANSRRDASKSYEHRRLAQNCAQEPSACKEGVIARQQIISFTARQSLHQALLLELSTPLLRALFANRSRKGEGPKMIISLAQSLSVPSFELDPIRRCR